MYLLWFLFEQLAYIILKQGKENQNQNNDACVNVKIICCTN